MPVRWTPENDQLLLLKILETHDLSVDPKRVAEAWPTTVENGKAIDRPTARAITERLVRMRKATCTNSGFSISNGNASGPSTPRRPRATGLKTPSSSKRKPPSPAGDADSADSKTVEENVTPTKKPLRPTVAGMNRIGGMLGQIGSTLKMEDTVKMEADDDDEVTFIGQGTPSKRLRKASSLASGMVSYKIEDDDDEDEDKDEDVESSASEYMPDHARDVNEDLFA
ncbi:uncharacterized protein KD926_010901 [Aspergillus affinis]|uniref:uncharacterized protein n=1 Tax=Aspergillus affinis TaxID=1070780 RepID=UPI0022FF33F5|nr:uncharacterized protein KD926_010901 [Aspergillus affinis]KAI9038365.1 hypothetical protein KD926_010901 [Aspergillus affinis]